MLKVVLKHPFDHVTGRRIASEQGYAPLVLGVGVHVSTRYARLTLLPAGRKVNDAL